MTSSGKLQRASSARAFTLIELLVVIAIIAILSVVVILVLNPSQLLQQSRDSNRLSDLSISNTALGIYAAQGGTSLGSSSIVYISVPDPNATSSAGTQCQGLNLPGAPSGTSYFCGASSTYRNPNGQGWIPVNFSSLPGGSPLGQLPQDPINQTSTGLYYTYATNGTQYVMTGLPESSKYKTQYGLTYLIPDYPEVLAQGTNYTLDPLYSNAGLVGYWPFEEGSGSSTADVSGNGNVGSWNGSSLGTNNTHYVGGKVGSYAGTFDGSTDYVNTANVADDLLYMTVSFWIKTSGGSGGNANIVGKIVNVANTNGWSAFMQPGGVRFVIQDGSGSNYVQRDGINIADGNWHFVVGIINGGFALGNVLMYVDNTSQSLNSTAGTVANISNAASVRFGTDVSSGQYFNGQLDDIRIYNRALSASEITSLYTSQK
jgi:prepilin-type N-terminal cleavage/methylation domain-containing protein